MLRYTRKDLLDLFQRQLCDKVKALNITDGNGNKVIVTDTDICLVERRGHNISKDKASAIAEALGVSSDTLWEPDPKRPSFFRVRTRTDKLEAQARAELKMTRGDGND